MSFSRGIVGWRFEVRRSSFAVADGGCDWNAGIPACNVAFFSDVKLLRCQIARAFSCFAPMQAGTPAFQSRPPSAANHEPRTTNHELSFHHLKLKEDLFPSKHVTQIVLPELACEAKAVRSLIEIDDEFDPQRTP